MKTSLTYGLTKEEAEELRGEFLHAYHLRQRLITMLRKNISSYQDTMRSDEAFLHPNFAMLQAEKLGRINEAEKIIALLEK